MSQPARVLYLITELSVAGGAENLMASLLGHLDRSCFTPAVACLYGADGTVADQIRALGVQVIDLGMTSKWRVDALIRLYRVLRRLSPEIVHGSLYHGNVMARVLGRLAGVPVVVSWRHSVDIGGRKRELVNRLTAHLGDRVVAVCESVRQAEIGRTHESPDRVVTIYNGTETKELGAKPTVRVRVRQDLAISPQAPVIGAIGRLRPEKGFDSLLTAMSLVRDRFHDVRLLLVGAGELREELESIAGTLGLANSVIFTGVRNDVPAILAALDCFVLSSRWEGLPLVLLEAMASGLPIVATEVGGVPELVVDGHTGILVPPEEPAELASAIVRLLHDPGLRQRMGHAGRDRVQTEFHITRMVRQLECLYRDLLHERLGWFPADVDQKA